MSSGAVIVGASAGLGRALAERMAEQKHDLVLAATDARDLEALARNIELKYGVEVHCHRLDLTDPKLDPDAVIEHWSGLLNTLDVVMFPVGLVDADDDRLATSSLLNRTLSANYTAVALLAAASGRKFETCRRGTIVAFSSIAAGVPRRRNMAYAAAKSALETYFGSLRHYFVGTKVLVQTYVLGYVDTAMSFGQKLMFKPVSAHAVADVVVAGLQRDVGRVFLPGYWRWITGALRTLPWWAYKKLRF